MTRPPADVGTPADQIDTPALVVDLDAYEKNLDRMAAQVRGRPVRLRPHAKTHKCPVVALHQIARGAVGVCCQKVSEAEAMVYGGVRNVLVTNEIVGAPKLARLAALARQADVAVCVDDAENVRQLDGAAAAVRRPAAGARRDQRRRQPLRCRAGGAGRRAGPRDRGGGPSPLRRAPGLPGTGPAHLRPRQAPGSDRGRDRPRPRDRDRARPGGSALRDRDRRRHRDLPVRGGQRRLHRAPGRLVPLHGRRLQARRGVRAEFENALFVAGHRDEPAHRRPRGGGRRAQGAVGGLGDAHRARAAGPRVPARRRRARRRAGAAPAAPPSGWGTASS